MWEILMWLIIAPVYGFTLMFISMMYFNWVNGDGIKFWKKK